MSLRVAIVRPGRPSYGEQRRTETWERLVAAAGGEPQVFSVLAGRPSPTARSARGAIDGTIVPEALLWRGSGLARALGHLEPHVVVLQTARTVRPELLRGDWRIIVDLVDLLSTSYRQRAALSRWPSSLLFRSLASAHRRFEAGAVARTGVDWSATVLAGRSEADGLGALWIPNLVEVVPSGPDRNREPPFDAVFFGSLAYQPNVEALDWLAGAGTAAAGIRVLVAGHAPSPAVRTLCSANGWTLVEDYSSLEWLASQAKVAVAPLQSTAGIQNKVLEAAAAGIAQVVTPAAVAGLGGELPARVVTTQAELLAAVGDLVDDDGARADVARQAQAFVGRKYSVAAWLPTFQRLTDAADGDPAASAQVATARVR